MNIIKNLTDQTVLLAVAQTGYTTTTFSAAAAQLGFAGTLKVVTAGLWSVASAWLATPFGTITAIIGGIYAFVKISDLLTVSLKEQTDKLKELSQKYDELKSKSKSAETELKGVLDRITELQNKDKLTLLEQGELDKLQLANAELQNQILLLKSLENQKQKEVQRQAIETLETKVISRNVNDEGDTSRYEQISQFERIEQDIKYYKQTIQELKSVQDQLTKDANGFDFAFMQSYSDRAKSLEKEASDVWSSILKQQTSVTEQGQLLPEQGYEDLKNKINDTTKSVFTLGGAIKDSGLNLEMWKNQALDKLMVSPQFQDVSQKFKELGESGELTPEVVASYSDFNSKLNEIGLTTEDVANNLNKVKDSSIATPDFDISTLSSSIDTLTSKFDLLTKSKKEFDDNGFLSTKTLTELKEQFGDYTNKLFNTEGAYIGLTDATRDYIVEQESMNLNSAIEAQENLRKKIEEVEKQFENPNIDRQLFLSLSAELVKLNEDFRNSKITIENYKNAISSLDKSKKSLEDLAKSFSDLTNKASSLAEVQKTISKSGKIDSSSLQTLIGLYPEAIRYANDFAGMQKFIADKLQDVKDEALNTYTSMLEINATTINSMINKSSELPNSIANYYKTDYDNFVKFSNGKYTVEAQTVKSLSELWAKYVGMSANSVDAIIKNAEELARWNSNGETNSFLVSQGINLDEIKVYRDMLNEAKRDFETIDITAAKPSSSGNSNKEDDLWKKEFEEQIALEKHRVTMGEQTEAQYLENLDRLRLKYFEKDKKYIKEKMQYEEESYNLRIKLAKEAYSSEKSQLDLSHEEGKLSDKEYYTNLKELNKQCFKDIAMFSDDYRKNEIEANKGLEKAYADTFNGLIQDLEHELFGAEQSKNYDKQIELYVNMQEELHKEADRYREMGYKETDDEIQNLGQKYVTLGNKIKETYKNKVDDIRNSLQETTKIIEDEISNQAFIYSMLDKDDYAGKESNLNKQMESRLKLSEKLIQDMQTLILSTDENEKATDNYKSSMETLNKAYEDNIKLTYGVVQSQKDLAQQQIDVVEKMQNDIIAVIKKRYETEGKLQKEANDLKIKAYNDEKELLSKQQKEADELAKKEYDSKVEYIDSRLKALKNMWAEEDRRKSEQESLDDISDIQNKINQLTIAANSGDAEAYKHRSFNVNPIAQGCAA